MALKEEKVELLLTLELIDVRSELAMSDMLPRAAFPFHVAFITGIALPAL